MEKSLKNINEKIDLDKLKQLIVKCENANKDHEISFLIEAFDLISWRYKFIKTRKPVINPDFIIFDKLIHSFGTVSAALMLIPQNVQNYIKDLSNGTVIVHLNMNFSDQSRSNYCCSATSTTIALAITAAVLKLYLFLREDTLNHEIGDDNHDYSTMSVSTIISRCH